MEDNISTARRVSQKDREENITTDAESLQTIAKMPESLKQQLLHYAKALVESHLKPDAPDVKQEKPTKRGGLGIWKGKI